MSTIRTCTADTPETENKTVRELILETRLQVIEMNGSQRQVIGDLYGVPDRQIVGLKQCVQELMEFCARWKTAWKVAAGVGGPVLGVVLAAAIKQLV